MRRGTAFPEVNAGSTGTTGPLSITSQNSFSGTVTLSCGTTYGAGSCSISPCSVSSFPETATLTINGTSFTAGAYSLTITGTSGSTVHTLAVPFNVGDYSISGTQNVSGTPGGQTSGPYALTVQPVGSSFTGAVTLACTTGVPAGAKCLFNPSTPVTPGNSAVDVVMSISTAARSRSKSSRQGPIPTAMFLFLPGIILSPRSVAEASLKTRIAAKYLWWTARTGNDLSAFVCWS